MPPAAFPPVPDYPFTILRGLFQQRLSPPLAWWEPSPPETRPSSPLLPPYFNELEVCTALDAGVKAHSSDAPCKTELAPSSVFSAPPHSHPSLRPFYGPISSPRLRCPWCSPFLPRSVTPTPPHTLPAAYRDLRPWHSSHWRNRHPATSEAVIRELPHSTCKHYSVSTNSCTSCIQSTDYSFL